MKNIRILLCIMLCVLVCTSKMISQESFEITYSTQGSESFSYSFEDNSNNYITVGGGKLVFGQGPSSPIIIKTDTFGNIIQEKVFSKQDTSYYFRFGFQKANGNYFIMATLSDSLTMKKYNVSYFCELSPDFDLVWEKMFTIPQPYKNHQMLDFILDADSNILIQGKANSSLNGFDRHLFIAKINQIGDVMEFNLYEGWTDGTFYGVFMHNFDSTGYVLLGQYPQNSTSREWVELNQNLEITDFVSVIDYDHYMSTPTSAKWLSNGNLIVGDMATMEPGAMQDLYVKIMDQDLNTVHDTLILYSTEPTYLATMNGIDYTDENNIWLGTFYGIPTFFSGTEVFRIHIFDANGHLKGMKVYGGDQRYWFTNLIATSDGGCIMTGAIPDYDGAENHDAYLIKVMPDDILTHAEYTPMEFDRDIAVFPNPFADFLYFKTLRKKLRVTLLDNTGKEALSENLSRLSNEGLTTGYLAPGFYYYTITDNGRIIQSGKLMKCP